MADNWIDIDRDGLRQTLARRPKSFVLTELIQNAWDQNTTKVVVSFHHVGRNRCELIVTDDDPDGFLDIADAYTMYKPSHKKSDPTKRGWINQGEKLVLAMCESAIISTTKGEVEFLANGNRRRNRKQLDKGSEITCLLKMTRAEYEEAIRVIPLLHVPQHINMWFNGKLLLHEKPLRFVTTTLPTLLSDEEGNMRRTSRKTELHLYKPNPGEVGHVYEMGIPVVETGDQFHYDVQQRVLLNTDRDNITPGYLQKLRVVAFNHSYQAVTTEDEAKANWVRDATSSPDCDKTPFDHAMDLRHGKKRVMRSPTDPESSGRAYAEGYNVLSGGSLTGGEHDNNKRFGSTPSSASVFPTPQVYHPDGEPEKVYTWDEMSDGMKIACRYSEALAQQVLGCSIRAYVVSWQPSNKHEACYGGRVLKFNNRRLTKKFFDPIAEGDLAGLCELQKLVIHEFGHEYASDHLSHEFHDALCDVGASLWAMAIKNPKFFQPLLKGGQEYLR